METKPWWDSYGLEIAFGADPYFVLERLVKETERRFMQDVNAIGERYGISFSGESRMKLKERLNKGSVIII